MESLWEEQKKDVVCVLDEAHLLERETLEEFRFLLNSEFDSASPLSLVLVGQTELWDKLRLQRYTAITQRIDMNIVLKPMDHSETGLYIRSHLAYASGDSEIFTPGAEEEIYKVSSGIPRMINRICEKSLMYSAQQKKKLIDEHVVRYVAEHEMVGGGIS
jgi:type II secretory pathway predicted ATPase ExeA